jgi:murein L,D-transpeptidase YcbB/YkuD
MAVRLPAIGLLVILTGGDQTGVGSSPGPQGALREAIAAERAKQAPARPAAERRDADVLYDRASGGPAWIDAAGRPTAQARAGLRLLDPAAPHGLDQAAHGVAELTLAASLDTPAPGGVARAARFDARMTAGVLRYFRELHLGRVDPRRLVEFMFPNQYGHDARRDRAL